MRKPSMRLSGRAASCGRSATDRFLRYAFAVLSVLSILVVLPASADTRVASDATAAAIPQGSAGSGSAGPARTAAPGRSGTAAFAGSSSRYRISPDRVFQISRDGGTSWEDAAFPGEDAERFAFGRSKALLPFTFGVDPADPSRVAVALPRRIMLSADAGRSWSRIDLGDSINGNTYISSVALSPHRKESILVGTSFEGFYESLNGGRSWTEISAKIGSLYQGAGFYEEVTGISYDPTRQDEILYALDYGKGLFRYRRGGTTAERIALPDGTSGSLIDRIQYWKAENADAFLLEVVTPEREWLYRPGTGTWTANRELPPARRLDDEARARRTLAEGRTGIYLAAHHATTAKLPAYLALLKEHGMNSIIVDFKDDFGALRYHSNLEVPRAAGAVRPWFNERNLIDTAHREGIYVIARVVVFQDMHLYRYDGSKYALWDAKQERPWGQFRTQTDEETGEEKQVQIDFWVDPHAEFVWNYNISIARELQDLGVDEIQFDYIRFPSDGTIGDIRFRHRQPGMSRTDVLEAFLSRARQAISIPIGTDVFGFNAWHRMGYLGQDIEIFSRYVDVISPMFYPSHFHPDFLPGLQYLDKAKYIYRAGSDRAVRITDGRVVIRPYVQAFLIGKELQYEKPQYTRYLLNQLDGVAESGASGFSLWNASGRYYMVTTNLLPYTSPHVPAPPVVGPSPTDTPAGSPAVPAVTPAPENGPAPPLLD